MSQIYEIERDLPPVYASELKPLAEGLRFDIPDQPVPPQLPPAGPIREDWDGSVRVLLGRRQGPAQLQPNKRPIKQFIGVVVAVLVLTLIGVLAWWQYNRVGQLIDPGG